MPPDWDTYGALPPAADLPRPRPQVPDVPPANKKQKTNQSLFGGPNVVAEDNNGHDFQTSAGDNFQAPGSIFPNGLAAPQGRRFRVPKPHHRDCNVRPSQGSIQGTPDQSLVAENARLKEHLAMQTSIIRALTIFASRHDHVLSILSNKLGAENNLTSNYDGLSLEIKHSIDTLRSAFPSLTNLITTHGGSDSVQETRDMEIWKAKQDEDPEGTLPYLP